LLTQTFSMRTSNATAISIAPAPWPDDPSATRSHIMTTHATSTQPSPVRPPSKHQLALMIWVAVFPTLTVLNLTIGGHLRDQPTVLRTLVLATIAVPIVMYGVMPHLHRLRVMLHTHLA